MIMAHGHRILLVDDLPKNIRLLEALLADTPYELVSAANGAEALLVIDSMPVDVVLLDVMMPDMDGFEVCRRIKENEKTRNVAVIMVTALDGVQDKVRGIEAGADDFISKPVNRQELLARTKSLVKAKRMSDRLNQLQAVMISMFSLTSLSGSYKDRRRLLDEFALYSALLTQADSALIRMRQDGEVGIYGKLGDGPERRGILKAAEEIDANFASGKIGMENCRMETPYGKVVGLPLVAYSGKYVGAILAFGVDYLKESQTLAILHQVARRLSSELELADVNVALEGQVAARTKELSDALMVLRAAHDELSLAQEETVLRLACAAEFRDEDTGAHLQRISSYSAMIAEACGMDAEFCARIRPASMMHDVGKIGTPDAILLKPSRLTRDEWDVMKQHTSIGAKILSGSPSALLQMSERIALTHHERFNGMGYPNGMKGEDIPIEGRIVALADVFDALTSRRVYKPAFTVDRSLRMITVEAGSHFDPKISVKFLEIRDELEKTMQQFPDVKE